MSDTNPEIPQIRPRTSTLEAAKLYFENCARFGKQGEPSMLEMGELQRHHAEMARTAALLSIAESLDRLADEPTRRVQIRRLNTIDHNLGTLAKELTKIRYMVRR